MNCTVFAKVVQLITVLSWNPRSFVFRYLLISFPPNHIAFLVVAVACRKAEEMVAVNPDEYNRKC